MSRLNCATHVRLLMTTGWIWSAAGLAIADDVADEGTEAGSGVVTFDDGSGSLGVEIIDLDAADVLATTGLLFVENGIGIEVAPISETLRTQLGLRDDRGVVVTSVEPDGPGDQAGIKLHDVLLSVGGEPVNDATVLQERLNVTAGESLSVILMRAGKRETLEIAPQVQGLDAFTVEINHSYWIGIAAAAADDALRVQLGLPEGTGLVVTEVYENTAADDAGIEVHDILLEFGGTSLSTVEELNNGIQENGGETATLVLVRGGDRLNVNVTPRAREFGQEFLWTIDRSASLLDLEKVRVADLYSGFIDIGDGTFLETESDEREAEQTTEQTLQGLIQEMRDLTQRLRGLQELIPRGDGDDESEEPAQDPPEAGGGDDS